MTLNNTDIELKNNSLCVSGNLDFASVVKIWNKSLPLLNQCPSCQFDLSNVTSCNSAGLALIIEWMKYGKRHHKKISFNNIPAQLSSIAKVCGVELSENP